MSELLDLYTLCLNSKSKITIYLNEIKILSSFINNEKKIIKKNNNKCDEDWKGILIQNEKKIFRLQSEYKILMNPIIYNKIIKFDTQNINKIIGILEDKIIEDSLDNKL